MKITNEKIKAILITIHSLLNSRIQINTENTKYINQEDNIYKLQKKDFTTLNNELLELVRNLEESNLTINNLSISNSDIIKNRIVYYYSVCFKEIENYTKKESNLFSSTLLSILILISLIEENGISIVKVNKKPSELFEYYMSNKISTKEIRKISILADKIIDKVIKANFSRMMKSKIKRNKKR